MKLRRGQTVRITFLDHVEGWHKPLIFQVHGRLSGITRTALVIDGWHDAPSSRQTFHPANHTRWTIVRSTIKEVEVATKWEKVT